MGKLKDAVGTRVRGELAVAAGAGVRWVAIATLVLGSCLCLGWLVGSGRIGDVEAPAVPPTPEVSAS